MGEHGNTVEAFVDGLVARGDAFDVADAEDVMAVVQEVLTSDLVVLPEGADAVVYRLRGNLGRAIFVLGPLAVSDNELAYTSISSVPVDLADLVDDDGDPRGVLLTLVAGVLGEINALRPAYERLYGKRAARGAIADTVLQDSCENSSVCPSCQVPWEEEHDIWCSFPASAEIFEDEEEG